MDSRRNDMSMAMLSAALVAAMKENSRGNLAPEFANYPDVRPRRERRAELAEFRRAAKKAWKRQKAADSGRT